ncbi:DNA end protector protein [Stenotrophomonas phage vB_SmaS-DLP_6]|nr:DNA end protector protein [Stenotrophomonas phage vB_SmaS-DLP_6]
MASQVFDKLLADAQRRGIAANLSRESVDWFRKAAQGVPTTAVSPSRMLGMGGGDPTRFENKIRIGHMYMFMYDPKTKASLPFYDRFPLIFPIGPAPGGFYGLNMHYLHPRFRAILMDRLTDDFLNNDRMDESTRMRASYKLLSSASKYRYFEPCMKHYLNTHVKSRFIYIAPKEWNMALFLPTERFEKANKQAVWKDSTNRINNP